MSDTVLWYDPEADAYSVRHGGESEEVGPVTLQFIVELLGSNANLRESLQYAMLRLIMAEGSAGEGARDGV